MSSKFQFELLRTLRKRTGLAKAFTLIELLIVVAIIGLLAAIGIPKYLDIRANAQAGAAAGEVVGLGKECAVYVASGGVGTDPTSGYASLPAGTTNTCALPTGGTFSRTFSQGTRNIKCINDVSSPSDVTVTVTVTGTTDPNGAGVVTCSFAAGAPAS